MRRVTVLVLAAAALAPAGPAAAQDGPPATAKLSVQRPVAVAGDRVAIRGTVDRFVAGQTVVVRVLRGDRKLQARELTVQPGSAGTGRFALGYVPRRAGRLVVRAQLGGEAVGSRSVDVLPRGLSAGSRGTAVRVVQRRLRARGYVVGRRGLFDARTVRAILTFRKVTGMARTSQANLAVMRRLARGGGRFRVRRPDHGRHIEADLSRQVIALVDDGHAQRIYPTSSGAPGTPTVRGSFRIDRKDPGTNALGMVHSSYFVGGYAIHGYRSVPTYNASHGCLRVPIPDALTIFRWARRGTRVDVYR